MGDSTYPFAITLFNASWLMNAALLGRWKEGRLCLKHIDGVGDATGSSCKTMGNLVGDFLLDGDFVGIGGGTGGGLREGKR